MNKEEIGFVVFYRIEIKGEKKKVGGSCKEEYFNFLYFKFFDNRRVFVIVGWKFFIGVMYKEFCIDLMFFG